MRSIEGDHTAFFVEATYSPWVGKPRTIRFCGKPGALDVQWVRMDTGQVISGNKVHSWLNALVLDATWKLKKGKEESECREKRI